MLNLFCAFASFFLLLGDFSVFATKNEGGTSKRENPLPAADEIWTLGLVDIANFVHCQDEYSRKIQKFDEQKQFEWILNENLCADDVSKNSLNYFKYLRGEITKWNQKISEEKRKVEIKNSGKINDEQLYCRKQSLNPFSMIFRAQNLTIGRLFVQKILQNDSVEQQNQLGKIVKSLQEKGMVLDLVRYENKLSHYNNVLVNIKIQLKQKLEFLKNSCKENSINIYGDHEYILDLIELNLSKVKVKYMESDITNAAQLWTLDKRPTVIQSLWVIRHGHRQDNIDKKLCTEDELARDDIPLSPLGIQQSQELGKRFENVTISKVFSSPFSRSVQTAIGLLGGAEAKSHAISINIEPGLAELLVPCSFLLGYYEVPELVKKFPLINPKYWPLFNKRTVSALESVKQVEEDDCKWVIKKTIGQILADNKNAEHIVLSTHGAFTAYLHEILTGEWTIVGQSSVTKFVRYYDKNGGEKDAAANYADKIMDKLRMEFTSDVTHLSDPYNTKPY